MYRLLPARLPDLPVLILCSLTTILGLVSFSGTHAAVFRDRLKPHWSEDNSHFWYRNDLADGHREFVLVDVAAGQRRAAFDHARLAKALEEAGVENVKAERLPVEGLKFSLPENTVELRDLPRGQLSRGDRAQELKRRVDIRTLPDLFDHVSL